MIYLDYASSTPIDPCIYDEFTKTLSDIWSNPSALHRPGQKAKAVLENARQKIANILDVKPTEIYFTPSSTVTNNLIIQTHLKRNSSVITTAIEHSSTKNIFKKSTFNNQYLEVKITPEGFIDIEHLQSLLSRDISLITVHLTHSEIGVNQPLQSIIEALNAYKKETGHTIYLHADASQSPQYLNVIPKDLGVDYLTISGQKIYAPRGTSVLFASEEAPLDPLFFGGSQEGGINPGTENVASAHATAMALQMCTESQKIETERVLALRDRLFDGLNKQINIHVNGYYRELDHEKRVANNLHFTLPNVDQESVILLYDQANIAISAGSACNSGSATTPDALLHLPLIQGAHIRTSLGRQTTQNDIDNFISKTVEIYTKLTK